MKRRQKIDEQLVIHVIGVALIAIMFSVCVWTRVSGR